MVGSSPAEGPGALVGVCGASPCGLLEQSPSSLSLREPSPDTPGEVELHWTSCPVPPNIPFQDWPVSFS